MKQKKQTVKTRDNNSKRKRAFSRASLMLPNQGSMAIKIGPAQQRGSLRNPLWCIRVIGLGGDPYDTRATHRLPIDSPVTHRVRRVTH
jgi:hypothetical protein